MLQWQFLNVSALLDFDRQKDVAKVARIRFWFNSVASVAPGGLKSHGPVAGGRRASSGSPVDQEKVPIPFSVGTAGRSYPSSAPTFSNPF